jgi:hypothetical protein
MSQSCPNQVCGQNRRSPLPWIALAAAVGISAAALAVAIKNRGVDAVAADAENLLDMCERAVSQLDARLAS